MISIDDWNNEWEEFRKKKRLKYLIGLPYPAFHFMNKLTVKKANYFTEMQYVKGYVFVPPVKLEVFELYVEYDGCEYVLTKLERVIASRGAEYTPWLFNGKHVDATAYKGLRFEEKFDLSISDGLKIESLFSEFLWEEKIKKAVLDSLNGEGVIR